MNDIANQLRKTFERYHVGARVQTYRNHDDISIYPTAREGWTDEQFRVVVDAIDGAELVTLSQRVTGRKLVTINQRSGFRYLRLKDA